MGTDYSDILPLEDLTSVKQRFTLEGKKALITGAAGGIGYCTAAAIAEMGADVALVDIKSDKIKRYSQFISDKFNVKTLAITCDITKEKQVNTMFNTVLENFGTLDCVHSNAGAIGIGYDDGDIGYEDWKRLIDINLNGMFLINQKAAMIMRDSGKGGSIVNTASISGHIINRSRFRHSICYPSAKAGVLHLTKGMAADFSKYNVRVNSISPGNTLSGIHEGIPAEAMDDMKKECPMGRFGTLDEFGGAVVFLLSDLASYITGADLLIDGGYCIW